MHSRPLLLGALVLLSAVSSLWAAPLGVRPSGEPFTKVPAGHWAYGECAELASLGLISVDNGVGFSGDPQLTRFEFGLALLDTLVPVDEAAAALGPQPQRKALLAALAGALRLSPRLSEDKVSQAAAGLRRLTGEFAVELRALDFNPQRASQALAALTDKEAVRAWRAEALSPPLRGLALTSAAPSTDTLQVPLGHGTIALSVPQAGHLPTLLDYLAQSAAALRPANAPNLSAADVGLAAAAEPALADPKISRLRTSYEYGLGSALTVSLAYEEVARRGQGMAALDAASLASIGLGYQLTSSTSVQLSYSLLEYANYALDILPLRDRVAETAVSIEF